MQNIFSTLGPFDAIPCESDFKASEFERLYKRRNLPVKLTNVIGKWPALTRWNPEFFRVEFGDLQISAGDKSMTVAEFVQSVMYPAGEAAERPYVRQTKLKRIFPELLRDIEPLPAFLQSNWLDAAHLPRRFAPFAARDFELLFGGPGTHFPVIHYDANHLHAFILQIFGMKEIYAFAPGDAKYLYPDPSWPNKSQVNMFGAVEEYPLLRSAHIYRTTLCPGECLFVPMGWWHGVINPQVSLAVTCNYVDASNWREFSSDWLAGQDYGVLKRRLASVIFKVAGWRRQRLDSSETRDGTSTA